MDININMNINETEITEKTEKLENNNNQIDLDSSTFKITYIQKENIKQKPISKSKLFQDFNFDTNLNTNLNTSNNSIKQEDNKICIVIENKTAYIKNKEFQLLIQV